jgi:hypothetical protein
VARSARSHAVRTAVARRAAQAIVRFSAHALRRRGRLVPAGRPTSACRFDVYTFVNDEAQYDAFLASARAAGFAGERARTIRLDDREEPRDPYALIRVLSADDAPRYPIVVHQDVRFDQGAGADELERVIAQLDEDDPAWVVAGNAGTTPGFRRVRRVFDPHGGPTQDDLPRPVVSLDENFLLFNHRCRPAVSPGLTGFHLYGTDVVLDALFRGGGAYVVDFPVTHLSAGTLDDSYRAARGAFVAAWRRRIRAAVLRTPNELIVVAGGPALRLLESGTVRSWLGAWGERP